MPKYQDRVDFIHIEVWQDFQLQKYRAAVTGEYFGRLAFGVITAVQGLPAQVLGAVGPLGAGYLYDRQGTYTAALWLCVVAFAVSALAVVVIPPARASSAAEPSPAGA